MAFFGLLSYVLFVDSSDRRITGLLVLLLVAVVVFHFVDIQRARRNFEEVRGRTAQLNPMLALGVVSNATLQVTDENQYAVIDVDTGRNLGHLNGEQLTRLISFLEKGGHDTNEYYVLAESPLFMREQGGLDDLATLFDQWLNGRESMKVRWVSSDEL